MSAVKTLFEDWKRRHGEQYAQAYCTFTLPDLLAPFVRLEVRMVGWDAKYICTMVGTQQGAAGGGGGGGYVSSPLLPESISGSGCLTCYSSERGSIETSSSPSVANIVLLLLAEI